MVQRDGATIDPGVRGESYNVDVYELVIGRAFEHVAVSARLKTDTWLRRRDRARGRGPAGAGAHHFRVALTAHAKVRGWDGLSGPASSA
jgi:hypothetical protein